MALLGIEPVTLDAVGPEPLFITTLRSLNHGLKQRTQPPKLDTRRGPDSVEPTRSSDSSSSCNQANDDAAPLPSEEGKDDPVEEYNGVGNDYHNDPHDGDVQAGDAEAGVAQAGDVQAGDMQAGDVQAGDMQACGNHVEQQDALPDQYVGDYPRKPTDQELDGAADQGGTFRNGSFGSANGAESPVLIVTTIRGLNDWHRCCICYREDPCDESSGCKRIKLISDPRHDFREKGSRIYCCTYAMLDALRMNLDDHFIFSMLWAAVVLEYNELCLPFALSTTSLSILRLRCDQWYTVNVPRVDSGDVMSWLYIYDLALSFSSVWSREDRSFLDFEASQILTKTGGVAAFNGRMLGDTISKRLWIILENDCDWNFNLPVLKMEKWICQASPKWSRFYHEDRLSLPQSGLKNRTALVEKCWANGTSEHLLCQACSLPYPDQFTPCCITSFHKKCWRIEGVCPGSNTRCPVCHSVLRKMCPLGQPAIEFATVKSEYGHFAIRKDKQAGNRFCLVYVKNPSELEASLQSPNKPDTVPIIILVSLGLRQRIAEPTILTNPSLHHCIYSI
ncbi:hypothetical protein GNI_091130 [Gregarina niphandrodes]|uniref:Uncharacterized protein n=1 Tax=Gregarina niphandrodes TaxID=110365 RepID=A0A023B5F5_GRENI|nr:hypothetical protein GNI_091130 [Gregarina niphandrodes]EZG60080.1 hypothetical protein GNI_091130 [Gregarina niphandrodes]|eukprot:XP_011130864.1 hypothetical protein GNI_091130 [Gregarina niphandrodes]